LNELNLYYDAFKFLVLVTVIMLLCSAADILVPLDNYISRGSAHFLACREPDYQQSLWKMISYVSYSRIIKCFFFSFANCPIEACRMKRLFSWTFFNLFYLLIFVFWSMFFVLLQIMADKNLEDNDIEPAPKLIEVVFQNCKGQVDQWVEPFMRITVERLRRTEKSYLKCLLMQVVRNYNGTLQIFDAWLFLFWLYFTPRTPLIILCPLNSISCSFFSWGLLISQAWLFQVVWNFEHSPRTRFE